MSSRTLRILANIRKAKYNVSPEISEMGSSNLEEPESPNQLGGPDDTVPPEYSFLNDDEMDDCDIDPDFNPSSSSDVSDEGEEDVPEEDVPNESSTCKTKPKRKRKVNTDTARKIVVVDLHHITGDSENIPVSMALEGNNQETEKNDRRTENKDVANSTEEDMQIKNSEVKNQQNNTQDDDNNKMEEIIEIEQTENYQDDNAREGNNNMTEELIEMELTENDLDNNNLNEIHQKRKRTLEEQMRNNKNKHPIREPCRCKMKCFDKISAEERLLIHEDYWNMDRNLQRIWLASKVTEQLSKRKLREGGRRDITRKYVLPKKNQDGEIINISVCQKIFLNTLGYGNANVLTSLRKSLTDSSGNKRLVPQKDQRGRHPPANKKDRNLLVPHINSFNPRYSHYGRKHAPNRKYLPPDLTIKFMHNDYNNTHPDFQVCYEVYRQTVDNMNIGFYEATPEKCGFCQELELNDSEENRQLKEEHLLKVKQIRQFYKSDQDIPYEEGRCFSADMQKVVLLPRMPDVKETFFTSRLVSYNETFASMQKKSGRHNLIIWHEGIAGRRAEDVASAFVKFLNLNRDASKIIVWMDNCTGQNKNFNFYSSLISYINSPYCSTNEIILKYLVKGHTFMAADGLHGRIEQSMRKIKNVYDFNDFKLACEKSSNRADVTVLEFSDFYKFGNIFRNRTKSNQVESIPYFKDIVCAKFVRGSTDFTYQTSPGGDFLTTRNTLKRKAKLDMPQAATTNRGVSSNKKAKIMTELVPKMPANRKQFWVQLPENDASTDLIEEGL